MIPIHFASRLMQLALFLWIVLLPCNVLGQSSNDTVRVATHECPPFVIHQNDKFTGLSIFLWDQIARELGVEYSIEKYGLKGMLDAVANGRADIGVSCLSITQEREKVIDFSHSFYETHLAIAVKEQGYLNVLKSILTNRQLLIAVGVILLIAAIIGGVLFALEHNINEKLYSRESLGGKLIETFIVGLMFVSRGPIRYYEFKTLTARILAAILAISSTLFIASFTAVLASAFTVDHLTSKITGPHDLSRARVAAKRASTSAEYLEKIGIGYRNYDSLQDMLEALDTGRIDAIVSDAAVMKYMINKAQKEGKFEKLFVLPYQFEKQNYGFALEDHSEHLEQLNQALLSVRSTEQWRKELLDYFNE